MSGRSKRRQTAPHDDGQSRGLPNAIHDPSPIDMHIDNGRSTLPDQLNNVLVSLLTANRSTKTHCCDLTPMIRTDCQVPLNGKLGITQCQSCMTANPDRAALSHTTIPPKSHCANTTRIDASPPNRLLISQQFKNAIKSIRHQHNLCNPTNLLNSNVRLRHRVQHERMVSCL